MTFLEEFNWSTIAILYTTNDYGYCNSIVAATAGAVDDKESFTSYVSVNTVLDLNNDIMVTAIMEKVRLIILFCFDANSGRKRFLRKAIGMNMMDDEYQYIIMAIRNIGFVNTGMTPFWEDVERRNDGMESIIKEAAKKLLIIDLSSEIKDQAYLAEFRASVIDRVTKPPLYCTMPSCLNNTGQENEKI
ncbi:hypothetical protein Aduo_011966 [Ancylostoma duodenale]